MTRHYGLLVTAILFVAGVVLIASVAIHDIWFEERCRAAGGVAVDTAYCVDREVLIEVPE